MNKQFVFLLAILLVISATTTASSLLNYNWSVDNFDGNDLDTSLWNANCTNGDINLSGGILTINSTGLINRHCVITSTQTLLREDDFGVRLRFLMNSTRDFGQGFGITNNTNTDFTQAPFFAFFRNWASLQNQYNTDLTAFVPAVNNVSEILNTTFYKAEILMKDNNLSQICLYDDSWGLLNCSSNLNANITDFSRFKIGAFAGGAAGDISIIKVDWISLHGDIIKENNNTFVSEVFDTTRQTFLLNLSLDSETINSVTATLNYNGTTSPSTFTATGDDRNFVAFADVPTVTQTQNHSFYWEFSILDTSNVLSFRNSTFNNQTTHASNFTQCTVALSHNVVNYTFADEDLRTPISADFDGTFRWRLNESSTIQKNYSVVGSGALNMSFCVNANETFVTDVEILLANDSYTDRTFGFNDENFNQTLTNYTLYLLNTTASRAVIIELKDTGLNPLEDYTIKIFRKIESTGEEILVENDITDVFGQIVTSLVENDVKYRLEFFNPENLLVKTIPNAIVACRATICVQQFIIEDTTDLFEDFGSINDYAFTLSFNNNTNIFSYTWVDNTGESSTQRLLVERILFNETTTPCNATSSDVSGVLTCGVGDQRASYRAQSFRTVGNDERRTAVLNTKVGDLSDTFGLEGLMWSFILLFTMILIGAFYPPVAIILYLVGIFLLGVLDMVFIHPAIIIAQIVIGVLFIWAFRG